MNCARDAIALMSDLLHMNGIECTTDPNAINAGLIWDRVEDGVTWTVAGYTVFIYQPPEPTEMGSHDWWGMAAFVTTADGKACGVNLLFGRTRLAKGWVEDSVALTYTSPPPSTGVLHTLRRMAEKASNSSPETYLRVLATALLRLHQAAA